MGATDTELDDDIQTCYVADNYGSRREICKKGNRRRRQPCEALLNLHKEARKKCLEFPYTMF